MYCDFLFPSKQISWWRTLIRNHRVGAAGAMRSTVSVANRLSQWSQVINILVALESAGLCRADWLNADGGWSGCSSWSRSLCTIVILISAISRRLVTAGCGCSESRCRGYSSLAHQLGFHHLHVLLQRLPHLMLAASAAVRCRLSEVKAARRGWRGGGGEGEMIYGRRGRPGPTPTDDAARLNSAAATSSPAAAEPPPPAPPPPTSTRSKCRPATVFSNGLLDCTYRYTTTSQVSSIWSNEMVNALIS